MIWRREDADNAQQDAQQEVAPDGDGRGGHMAEQGSEVTVVGAGAKLEGTIVSAGSLRVDGHVKGNIQADGDVMLSPQSSVEADIRAENLSVAGRFHGSIVVKGRAELARGGRIDGNITAKSLVIQEGGIFNGQSIMDQQATAAPAANTKAQVPQQQAQQAPERTHVP
jgi:cytoskeletal protein CcmA (bactofilin family)